MKSKVNIGTSSLILIFIVLCLATFGLLSLSSAEGDRSLALRNAQAVKGYYAADNEGQEFLRQVDRLLAEEPGKETAAGRTALMVQRLGGAYDLQRNLLIKDVPMERGQSLHIELALTPGGSYEIRSWYVYNSEEYEIDDSMPVWNGEDSGETLVPEVKTE